MSWYYLKKRKTIGPLSIGDMSSLIETHQVLSKDLVSFELNNWNFAYKHPDLFKLFKNIKFHKVDPREWVVTIINKDGGRKQVGPFTQDEVLKKVMSGQIKYADLIWCKDMLQWYPISMLEIFNKEDEFDYYKAPKKASVQDGPGKPYLIYQHQLPKIELPPEEAEGESLV